MITLESDQQLQELIKNDSVILMFSAEWCPDCRVIEPVLPELEEKYNEWLFVYVDRDTYIHVCAKHDIFGIPSFIAYRNGQEAGRFVSKERKTRDEIEVFIQQLNL